VNVLDYGAKGDGTTVDRVAINAAIQALPERYGVLYFPPLTYNIGPITSAAEDLNTLLFDHKYDLTVIAYGAKFIITTTGSPLVWGRLIHHPNVDGFTWLGGSFYDLGSDISLEFKMCDTFFLWYGYSPNPVSPGRIRIEDVYCNKMGSLAIIGGTYATPRLRDIHITGTADQCFYGVVLQENGDQSYCKLLCLDCRRAYFVYGVTGFEADIHAVDTAANFGSSALIIIHAGQGNTTSGRLKATIVGYAEHSAAVALTIQRPAFDGPRAIRDVEVDLHLENLVNPQTMVPVGFTAYNPAPPFEGDTQSPTDAQWQNIRIRGDFGGYPKLGGNAILFNSIPLIECRLSVDDSLLPWLFVGAANDPASHFPNCVVQTGPETERRWRIGDISTQTIRIPCYGYLSNPFMLRVTHWINDGALLFQNTTFVEDVLFAYADSGGAVGIVQRSNLHDVNYTSGATVTYTAVDDGINVTYSGAAYNTSTSMITQVVQRLSAFAYSDEHFSAWGFPRVTISLSGTGTVT
jgi:hypothetical protein